MVETQAHASRAIELLGNSENDLGWVDYLEQVKDNFNHRAAELLELAQRKRLPRGFEKSFTEGYIPGTGLEKDPQQFLNIEFTPTAEEVLLAQPDLQMLFTDLGLSLADTRKIRLRFYTTPSDTNSERIYDNWVGLYIEPEEITDERCGIAFSTNHGPVTVFSTTQPSCGTHFNAFDGSSRPVPTTVPSGQGKVAQEFYESKLHDYSIEKDPIRTTILLSAMDFVRDLIDGNNPDLNSALTYGWIDVIKHMREEQLDIEARAKTLLNQVREHETQFDDSETEIYTNYTSVSTTLRTEDMQQVPLSIKRLLSDLGIQDLHDEVVVSISFQDGPLLFTITPRTPTSDCVGIVMREAKDFMLIAPTFIVHSNSQRDHGFSQNFKPGRAENLQSTYATNIPPIVRSHIYSEGCRWVIDILSNKV